MKEIIGQLNATELRIGIVVSRFNSMITERLLKGALDCIKSHGGQEANLTVVHVPGSFEVAGAAQRLAGTGRIDAIVCLGCLIRGETDHYEHIAHRTSEGLMRVMLDSGIPVAFGVLTVRSADHAHARSAPGEDNKGAEAAEAAVRAANLLRIV